MRTVGIVIAVCLLVASGGEIPAAPQLTLEVRVRAERALQRVDYIHTIGATQPFEVAIPEAISERNAADTLRKSLALERIWKTAITGESLQAELARMARQSRNPDRLAEKFDALGNDPVLLQECLARPALVDRLVRSFYAWDDTFHAGAKAAAEALHARIAIGGWRHAASGADVPRLVRIVREQAEGAVPASDVFPHGLGSAAPEEASFGVAPMTLDADAFDRLAAGLPSEDGVLAPLREERDGFVSRVVLGRSATEVRLAVWVTPKRSWDEWWRERSAAFDPAEAATVANQNAPLPALGAASASDAAAVQAAAPQSSAPDAAVSVEASSAGGAADSSCPDDSWISGALDDVPDPRTGPTAVWTGSRLIVWGGYTGDIAVATGGRYDPATDTWTPTSTIAGPAGRYFHTAVWTGSAMIVWGGRTDANGTVTKTGARYDPVADAWTPISQTNAPSARRGHTAVWTGSRMVVWGSYEEIVPGGGRYDPATDSWSPVASAGAPTERHAHTAVWTGSRMIVWGGVDNILPGTIQSTGGLYDPVMNSWTATSTTNAPAARRDHTAVWTGTLMIVWGGSTGDASVRTGGRYDPGTNGWTPTSTTNAPSARSGHTAVWSGSVMIVWAGNGPSGAVRTGGRYAPGSNMWTPTSLTGAPAGRASHVATWAGTSMIVWGGQDSVGSVNTGGRYDPATDAWTPTSVGVGPETRKDHTAVWTGSRMIVWGGSHGFQYLASGGVYDPATDVWTPTAVSGAPEARVLHTATWAGSRMIVWGGSGSAFLSSGGRYDPVTDVWSATNLTGAPAPRRAHSAVWTGQRLVIWGGTNVDPGSGQLVPLDSGGRYDPVGDAWSPTADAGKPAARGAHAAAWTGSRMFVWGGDGGTGAPFLGDGSLYDPQADGWSPVAVSGAPSPRQEMTAVAVGSKIVVWGGFDPTGSILADGGRYDAAGNTWSPASSAGAPEPRRYGSVVSSGNEMILWGGWIPAGSNPVRFLDTGGRYDPQADVWRSMAVPSGLGGRRDHTAVWAGDRMIVWGGTNGSFGPLGSGGGYCACLQQSWHPDADGDGFGNPGVAVVACAQPAGHVLDGSDCNDGALAVWATPSETGSLLFTDGTTLAWQPPAQPGAQSVSYDVLRSTVAADFTGSICLATGIGGTTAQDPNAPVSADPLWSYLVRARNGCPGASGVGSLGSASNGSPRAGRSCP